MNEHKARKWAYYMFLSWLNMVCLIWFSLLGFITITSEFWFFFGISAFFAIISYNNAEKLDRKACEDDENQTN